MTKKHLQDYYYNQHAEDVCYGQQLASENEEICKNGFNVLKTYIEDVCYGPQELSKQLNESQVKYCHTYIDDAQESLSDYVKTSVNKVTIRVPRLDPATSKQGKEIVDSEALHPDFVAGLAKVAQVSIEKGYLPFNWLEQNSPVRVSTLLQAHARHVRLAKLGFNDNQEKKLDGTNVSVVAHHLEHAAYNLLMAAKIIKDLPDHDDRKFKNGRLK